MNEEQTEEIHDIKQELMSELTLKYGNVVQPAQITEFVFEKLAEFLNEIRRLQKHIKGNGSTKEDASVSGGAGSRKETSEN